MEDLTDTRKGEEDLEKLIQTMNPVLRPEVFAFITLQDCETVPQQIQDCSVFMFREREGRTYVLARSVVETLGYQFEYPCRMITLEVHSSLAAVGFLAVILRHLAEHGISCNVASGTIDEQETKQSYMSSGFYHDHLFVQDGEETKVMELLKILSESVNESSDEELDEKKDLDKSDNNSQHNENVVLYSDSE